MNVGEQHHTTGYDGVRRARDWLDRTARASVRYAVYDWPEKVAFRQLNGPPEGFDLVGDLLDEDGQPCAELAVEVKNYSTAGDQATEYLFYAAKCASITQSAINDAVDPHMEFMWLTWHPFAQTKWSRLCKPETIEEALKNEDIRNRYIGPESIDEETIAFTATKMWLIVLGSRSEELVIPKWLMGHIRQKQVEKASPR